MGRTISDIPKSWIQAPKGKNWLIDPSVKLVPFISKMRAKEIYLSKDLNIRLTLFKTKILENWDTVECKDFSEENWKRTSNLIEKVLKNLWSIDIKIFIPLILPHYDSSFDIHWEDEEFHLTVNIPTDLNQLVDLYGKKNGSPEDELEVLIHYDLVEAVLISWLKKIL
ncbi:hypothetical protein LCGC14_1857980 [marine sediment metagenome]|uniref:Uncharacterized protein n=1 Tax=marine sediment metagenome TaxID=412755 RepID=A0A0F9G8Q3_9ZZZZ